jgi:hypothetical protein
MAGGGSEDDKPLASQIVRKTVSERTFVMAEDESFPAHEPGARNEIGRMMAARSAGAPHLLELLVGGQLGVALGLQAEELVLTGHAILQRTAHRTAAEPDNRTH